jgi:precorrin-2 dehydrogenase / sirohydrochlorin ferrochelatase
MAMNLFPVALDLRGKRCVVVGGGTVGARKVKALLEASATVVVVAPDACEEIRGLAENGAVTYFAEAFAPAHLDGAFLVIAATDLPAVNEAVARATRERGVLLNLSAPGDDAESGDFGDFATMATVRRGGLLVALTTGGAGPALTAWLARQMGEQFGTEWAEYVSLMGEMRTAAKIRITDAAARTAALRRLAAADGIREKLAAGDRTAAREEAMACLFG